MAQESCSGQAGENSVIYRDQKISYRELDEVTDRFANSLLGLGKGDRVGILLPRISEIIVSPI